MANTLASDSPTELLLRGFLWVEWALDQLLEAQLVEYERFAPELRRLRFPQKLTLAEAFGGFLWPEPYRELNRLRNHLAHDPWIAPGLAMARRLLASFPDNFARLDYHDETLIYAEHPTQSLESDEDRPEMVFRVCIGALVDYLHASTVDQLEAQGWHSPKQIEVFRALRKPGGDDPEDL